MEGTNVAFYLVKSFHNYCPKIIAHLLLSSNIFASSSSSTILRNTKKIEAKEVLTYDDVKAVQERIGMVIGWGINYDDDEEEEDGKLWMEALDEMLEEKEASMEELKEAFYVFDRNEDGFISAAELWNVMRRLGMKEGMRMEDCEKMICAFDEDGDGRISFLEFKKMLENAL